MLDVKTNYATYKNCYVKLDHYMADNTLCVELVNLTDGPIARITTCLVDGDCQPNEAYVDTNNCPWAEQFIKDNKLGKPVGIIRNSGFCSYTLYEFDMDELVKHMEE